MKVRADYISSWNVWVVYFVDEEGNQLSPLIQGSTRSEVERARKNIRRRMRQ